MEQLYSLIESIGAWVFVFLFIGLCIFVHELGHFLAGRWRKLHIDAFSIGFKKIWSKKVNGVEYRIGCIPLGGYVELPQVDATDEIPRAADGTELKRAKPLDRIVTAAAGPFFNILFGLLLGCVVWIAGVPQDSPVLNSITVAAVETDSPEYNAGLRPGDVIVRLNGEKFSETWGHFVQKIMFSIGEVKLDILRDGSPMQISYIPKDNPNAPGKLKYEKIGYPFFSPVIPIELCPAPGSPAEKAGIKPGDTLLSINGNAVTGLNDFQMTLNRAGDSRLDFIVLRNGKEQKISLCSAPVSGINPADVPFMIGILQEQKDGQIHTVNVYSRTPADKAGLKPGDIILSAGDRQLALPEDLNAAVTASGGKPMSLQILRDGKKETVSITPVRFMPRTIGVELMLTAHPTPWEQLAATVDSSYKSLRGMLIRGANALGLTQKTSTLKPSHMSGPLGMGTTLYSSVKNVSWSAGLYFVVMISFALAIFNLLPLPVLDGGHILFALTELVIRRPLPAVIIKGLSFIFISLLIGLMLYITYFDIMRSIR